MTTSTEIDVRNAAALAIRPDQEFWTREQRAALAVLGIRNASNADLAVFMHYCQKTQLDPFSKQIYGIMRREKQGDQWVDKFTIQVGISGFQVIRDRIAARLGVTVEYEDTVWFDRDGGEHGVWLWDTPPAAAKVVVLKDGKRYSGVCRTAAYMQKNKNGDPAGQWRTQPENMIEKCAEAKALRRAFPHDLGGIYIEEEMPESAEIVHQASPARLTAADITGTVVTEPANGNGHTQAVATQTPAEPASQQETAPPADPGEPGLSDKPGTITADQRKTLVAALRELGYGRDDAQAKREVCEKLAGRQFARSTTDDMSEAEAERVTTELESLGDREALDRRLAEIAGAGQ
jgi:phage recombination protein Bet